MSSSTQEAEQDAKKLAHVREVNRRNQARRRQKMRVRSDMQSQPCLLCSCTRVQCQVVHDQAGRWHRTR
jgi:hypothetical protein